MLNPTWTCAEITTHLTNLDWWSKPLAGSKGIFNSYSDNDVFSATETEAEMDSDISYDVEVSRFIDQSLTEGPQ